MRSSKEKRKFKMYGLVPYNISDKQKGIQFGHAVVRYGRKYRSAKTKLGKDFNNWEWEGETFIILDGGTTNLNPSRLGTLNIHLNVLEEHGIKVATFHEVDLGDQLSAVVFLVDDRVWDRVSYPDFEYPRGAGFPKTYNWDADPAYIKWKKKFNTDKYTTDTIIWLRSYLRPLKLA